MDIEISNLKYGKAYATEEIHFTGGLRGSLTDLGWALFPISSDPHADALVFTTSGAHFNFATQECGIVFIGSCVKYHSETNSPSMDVWEFGKRDPLNRFGAADSWGFIGHRATLAGDHLYAETASCISASLRTVGLRLRDVSNRYHDQLNWALAAKMNPGHWFSNAALQDLYADFHALASELSSTRDYLAKMVATHIGAPDRIDSAARLEDWLEKQTNHVHATNQLAQALLTALGTKANPGWLKRIGDIRNEMLHRIPMSANKSVSGAVLEQVATSLGPILKVRLGEPLSKVLACSLQFAPR